MMASSAFTAPPESRLPHIALALRLHLAQVAQLYQRYCSSEAAGPSADPDSSREASRQREYLERSLEGLRRKLARESAAAHSEHLRLMGDNCALLREVNELRREVRALRAAAGAGATAAAGLARWVGGGTWGV